MLNLISQKIIQLRDFLGMSQEKQLHPKKVHLKLGIRVSQKN